MQSHQQPIPPPQPQQVQHQRLDPHSQPNQDQVYHTQHTYGTPDQPTLHLPTPKLHDMRHMSWADILTATPTARHIPPQCRAACTEIIARLCDHILYHTANSNNADADDAWKLLMAFPQMLMRNTNQHRAGKRGQGKATHTQTLRQRARL